MSESDGQVSEVSGMGEAPEEISPEDAVAGAPEAESVGAPDSNIGTAGPDAPPREGRPGAEPDPDTDPDNVDSDTD